jgi:hypothetical protein
MGLTVHQDPGKMINTPYGTRRRLAYIGNKVEKK